jgi:tetratricopeptide (TPR) repeat protein
MLATDIELRLQIRASLHMFVDAEEAAAQLAKAEDLAAKLGDPRHIAMVSATKSHYLWMKGQSRGEPLTLARSALAIAEEVGDLPLQVWTNHTLGGIYMVIGDYRAAARHLRGNLNLLSGERAMERMDMPGFPAVLSRSWLAWTLAEMGNFGEASAHGTEGLRLAEALGHPYSLIQLLTSLGRVHALRGELIDASAVFQRARALSVEWNLPFWALLLTVCHGWMLARTGRVAEGLAIQEEPIRAYDRAGGAYYPLFILFYAETLLLADQITTATERARQALGMSQERGERGHEAYAWHLLGEIAITAAHPDFETADSNYRQALTLAESLSMRPLAAHCHLGLAKLYRQTGQRDQVGEHLTHAITMYREMGIRYWLAQAEAELAAVR